MSNRDRNNRKSGLSESNRHNKYHNKYKNNHWGRNFNNYGNSNYRNTDYGSGHSDNRYNNWNQTLPIPWDTDWFNNQHPPNFTNNHYGANNFNIATGLGVNFPRPNRSKNLKEWPDHRAGDRNFVPKSQGEPNSCPPVEKIQKKIAKSNKDTPSTVTSSSSSAQPCSSNSVEKPTDAASSKQNEHNAEQVTKKLFHQLTSMNKHNLKQMINNPTSKYETALQTHARARMRAEMRSKLQNMSSNQENQLVNNVLDTEESVDMDKIPDNVFDEIGRVLDINLLGQDDASNKKYNDSDDKDKEQIAYPEDLFLRAEKLLMENSILIFEDRLNDSMLNVNNDRSEDDRTPVKIKNEIKEEPDDMGDDNFFEIQESGNDNFLLNDLVFEDREGSMSLRNESFGGDQSNEVPEKEETSTENHQSHSLEENRVEMVRIPTTSLFIKEENVDIDRYEETTNNNLSPNCHSKSSSRTSSKRCKSPDKRRPVQSSSSTNNNKTTTKDDYRTVLANVKQEFDRETESNIIGAASQEPPKKIDLFTKLQNSGAFESTSVKRRADTKLDSTDYKRDNNLYSRKKKKKHKSRSRSISRLRSRSRSPSYSRTSHRSKKSSRDRSRKRDTSQYTAIHESLESRNTSNVANIDFSNDSSVNPLEQNDELSNKIVENVEPVEVDNRIKTESTTEPIHEVCSDDLTNSHITATHPDEAIAKCVEESTATEPISEEEYPEEEFQSKAIEVQHIEPAPLNDSTNLSEQVDSNAYDSNKLEDQAKQTQSNSIVDIVTDTFTEMIQETCKKAFEETVTKTATGSAKETIADTVEETFVGEIKETIADVVKDTIAAEETVVSEVRKASETSQESVVEASEEVVVEASQEAVVKASQEADVEASQEAVVEASTEMVAEAITATCKNEFAEAAKDHGKDTLIPPAASMDSLLDEKDGNTKLPDVPTEITVVAEVMGDESSTSIGSHSAENSLTLNSESQSSIPDEAAELGSLKSNPSQKNSIVAIRKIVLKPSSSRHQKTSSKHKCEKERHASSSHKSKKSDTASQSSKKSDHKDNTIHSTPMTKQSHSDQTHRVWRSAGEKKCIEPTKSTLRNIDIFDPARPVESLKVVEPAKAIESKSSTPRKERGKSQSQSIRPPVVPSPQPRIEPKKGSTPTKKGNTIGMKEKISSIHRHHPSDSNQKSTVATESVTNHTAPLLSDSLKLVTENNTVLQRMKDIDLKIMEMQVKKTSIDEQIHNLHKEKSVIDQTTIQLHNERFLLLSSLLTNNAVSQAKHIEQKVVEVSSDDEVLTVGTRKITSKNRSNASQNSKRKIDDDVKSDGDGTKCKKLKINLNPLKPLTNNKNNAKMHGVDEVQSDLKTKMLKASRRCSVRLTKLSAKKIKSLIGVKIKSVIESDEGDDAEHRNDGSESHRMMFDGSFSGHKLPIVHLQVVDGFLIAASEDSNLYMHDVLTGKLLGTFTEHTKTVTNFIATENKNLYSVSLDGCLKKLCLTNFDAQLLSINVGEALQVMEYSWDTAFIGSRSGKIYIFDTKTDTIAEECLCSVGKSIMALKATKEGPRKILIASSRCHNISVRDAISGLLLRTIEVPDKLTIYSILLDGGQLYCGTNKNLVFRYEFTSGAEISRIKLGTGTICLKSYKNSLILGGCYDGYIYAYDTKKEIQLSRFPGPGRMLLHFDVYKDNIIAAAKDKSLCVLEVPHDIVSHE